MERLLACLILFATGQSHAGTTGTIQGVVVNGSRGDKPIANAEVLLRGNIDGVFESLGTTTTDSLGTFSLQEIPVDSTIIYLPGANHHGVHYSGQRVRIDTDNKVAQVKIVAYDAVHSVSPLTAKRHNISVEADVGLLKVTETLLISNPSHETYVGESASDEAPVTLRLSIPSNFDRVTFDSEFYGRRFRIIDHQLVTDLPWPPGERELKLTYRVPIEKSGGLFRRSLDLPSANLCVQVDPQGQQVSCNLAPATLVAGRTVFAAKDKQFPIGYTIVLQVGDLPIPWALYGRWASLAAAGSLVVGTLFVSRVRNRRHDNRAESCSSRKIGTQRRFSAKRGSKRAIQLARADRMNS